MPTHSIPKIITDSDLQTEYFHELSVGNIPAIIFPKILDKRECDDLSAKILSSKEISVGLGSTEKIGESLNSYISNKFEYFKKSKSSNDVLKKIFSYTDPQEKMLAKISASCGKKIQFAREKSQPYSHGIIRLHQPGTMINIHRDNASFEASNFSVSELSGQLSAILHLQSAESGGTLSIFDKFWTKADEKHRKPVFGYSKKAIKNTPQTSISCNQGDLVLINPKKYHSVNAIKGKLTRITFGFFFGYDKHCNLFAWS